MLWEQASVLMPYARDPEYYYFQKQLKIKTIFYFCDQIKNLI